MAASHQAEGRGRQGAGSRKVGVGGWGSQRETKKLEAVISGGLSSGNILGRKEKAPLAGSSHARGSEVTDNKCVVHSADVWEIKCAGC